MTDTLFWTLDDYERFIQHGDYFARDWAVHRIQNQHPEQTVGLFASLLTDPDTYHRIVAAQTLGQSGDPKYEPDLQAALPDSTGNLRHWITVALGQLRSQTLLPQLVSELEAAGTKPSQGPSDPRWGAITALRYYSGAEARAALWQFVERYPQDDHLAYAAFEALLRFPEVDAVPRLVQRYRQLTPGYGWSTAISALANPVGLRRLAEELTSAVKHRPDAVWERLEMWLDQLVTPSTTFEEAFEAAVGKAFHGLLPHVAAEIKHVAAEQEDALDDWRAGWAAGELLTGYHWRMTYGDVLVSALADQPSRDRDRYLAEVGLCLAVLGQVLTDYDDEGALATATDAEERRQILVEEILGSPRQNVMPDVVEQVAALGPAVVPDLIAVLQDNYYWGWERALKALAQIARAHPGAADGAVAAILDLIYEGQGDYVLETASDALRAISPAVVEPAADRLGTGDFSYDIYVTGALGEIPAEASVDALLAYAGDAGVMEEWLIESLVDLGHSRAMPVLKSVYQRDDPLVACALYTIGLLNEYTGPEMHRWRAVAWAEQERFQRIMGDADQAEPAPARSEEPDTESEKRGRRRRRRKKSERKDPKSPKAKRKRRRRRKRKR